MGASQANLSLGVGKCREVYSMPSAGDDGLHAVIDGELDGQRCDQELH